MPSLSFVGHWKTSSSCQCPLPLTSLMILVSPQNSRPLTSSHVHLCFSSDLTSSSCPSLSPPNSGPLTSSHVHLHFSSDLTSSLVHLHLFSELWTSDLQSCPTPLFSGFDPQSSLFSFGLDPQSCPSISPPNSGPLTSSHVQLRFSSDLTPSLVHLISFDIPNSSGHIASD
jgi:hypothetical protein